MDQIKRRGRLELAVFYCWCESGGLVARSWSHLRISSALKWRPLADCEDQHCRFASVEPTLPPALNWTVENLALSRSRISQSRQIDKDWVNKSKLENETKNGRKRKLKKPIGKRIRWISTWYYQMLGLRHECTHWVLLSDFTRTSSGRPALSDWRLLCVTHISLLMTHRLQLADLLPHDASPLTVAYVPVVSISVFIRIQWRYS